MDFVRKAVRAIGRCALKIESAAERCVAVLVLLFFFFGERLTK
jgi:AP-1 complex subunit beta-1